MFAEETKVSVRLHKVLAVIILLLLFTINFLQAQPTEQQVIKSMLIWQIADRHIGWPKETGIDNRNTPFVIGVVGNITFGEYLEQFYNGQEPPMKIKNKKIVIRNIKRVEQIPGCNLLFVPELPRRFFARVIEFTQDKPILTLAETEDYIELGIHIYLLVGNTSTPRLVINEKATRLADLQLSEELLNNESTQIIHPFRPYEEKAEYLEPISRFIDWPSTSAADDPSKPFKIEILGRNFFGPYLEKIYRGKKLKNKRVVINCISKMNEISNPHFLFISKSMKNNISEIIAYTKNKPIITIGDTPGFCQAGVHINFFYDRLKLSFEINEAAANAAGFNIRYHLLKLAKTNSCQ
jgi:hypothetical protein